MGQKINPTIFRLGFNKTWKTEFFEKKKGELPLYVFKDLEIRNYIERVLETYGILLHDYKHQYNGSTLNLYISYFITPDFILNKKEANDNLIIKNTAGKRKIVKNQYNNIKRLAYFPLNKKVSNSLKDFSRLYKIKQYLKLMSHSKLFSEISSTQSQEFSTCQKESYMKPLSNSKLNGVFFETFKVLNLFSNDKLNVVFNFCYEIIH